ncbi:MAG: Gfo/Idh/MocA family oxidoreductase, partial [Pseudomonadota bacterium]
MTTPLGPPFKVAIVGVGYFSQFHQQSWRAIQQTDIVAVCDTDSERASAVAADLGVSAYSDLDALLTAHDPDIVDIVAP